MGRYFARIKHVMSLGGFYNDPLFIILNCANGKSKLYETERKFVNGICPVHKISIPTSPVFSLIATTVAQPRTPQSGSQCAVRPVTSSPWCEEYDVTSGVCDAFNICSDDAGPRLIIALLLLSEGASSWKKTHELNMNYLLSKLSKISLTNVTWDIFYTRVNASWITQ